jgi:hypothetical protein
MDMDELKKWLSNELRIMQKVDEYVKALKFLFMPDPNCHQAKAEGKSSSNE